MKVSAYDELISAYKTYISDFLISVTSGQVIFATSPLYLSQWAKTQLRYIYFGASLIEWNHIV